MAHGPLKKSQRFQEYISHYYRFLYIFGLKPEREHTFIYLFSLSVVFLFGVLFIFEMADDNAALEVLKFILQFILGGTLALGLFVGGVWLRISADDEVLRSDKSKFEPIPAALTHPMFLPADKVAFDHDMGRVSRPGEAVQILLNTIEIDTDSYYRIHAGSLDIPKVSLVSADLSRGVLRTGIASFRDTFFTHYFPDFPLSRSSSGENKAEANTLRSLVGPDIAFHYSQQSNPIEAYPGIPSPLGVTGSVRITCSGDGRSLWLLQKRGSAGSADRMRLQMGYAGIIDAIPFFHSRSYGISELIRVEFDDEVKRPLFGADADIVVDHTVLGLCFNPNFLFQPELLVHTEATVTSNQWDMMRGRPQYSTEQLLKGTIRVREDDLILVTDDGWLEALVTDRKRVREIDVTAGNLLREWLTTQRPNGG